MFLRSFFKKKNYLLWLLMLCLVIPIIYACGDNIEDEIVSPHILRGNASKGPIYPGVVTAYKILADKEYGILGTAQTDSNGEYIISFEGYTGPVILEVYGTYYDEATGEKKQIDPNKPLHAVISSTSQVIKVAITPLTDIAYQRATVIGRGKDPTDPNMVVFDSSTIEQANSEIINIFGIDIIRTVPIDITEPYAVNNADNEDEVIYGLYLAAISKMASDPYYNVNDPLEMISILASQFKDGKPGEKINKDEITLPEIGQSLIDVTNDPNIYPPINKGQLSKIANRKNKFINVAYFDPNGVPLIPSPVSGDTPLAQAQAMIDELRNTALTLWDYQEVGDPSALERFVSEIENDVIPELEELGEMAYILSVGIQKIFEIQKILDPNNEIDDNILVGPDPIVSLQYSANIDCNDLDPSPMYFMDCNDVNYDIITLGLNIDFNAELLFGLDSNILAEILVNPNDPNTQSKLLMFLGGLPCVEANYSIEKDGNDYVDGDLTFSLDPNGKINGLTLSEPVWDDPNMEIPSKMSLIGEFAVPDGSLTFDGTIEDIYYDIQYPNDMQDPNDIQDLNVGEPNVTISFIGKLNIAERPEVLFTMKISTTQTDVFEIDNLSFTYGGISIWGNGSINLDPNADHIDPNADQADQVLFDLQNQDSLDVHIDFRQGVFSGWIKKGSDKLGAFKEREGNPVVIYSNGDIESI